jgi:hypothetical protein
MISQASFLATRRGQNILYLDLESDLVKLSHHARFDKAWYLQPHCPPAAQLLYNLGIEADNSDPPPDNASTSETVPTAFTDNVPWPRTPNLKGDKATWTVSPLCRTIPLPLREVTLPQPTTAAVASLRFPSLEPPAASLFLQPEYLDGHS